MDCAGLLALEWMIPIATAVGIIGTYIARNRLMFSADAREAALAWGYLRYDNDTLDKMLQVYLENPARHRNELEALRLVGEYRAGASALPAADPCKRN